MPDFSLQSHEDEVNAIAVSPLCEEIFATGGCDGRFYIFQLNKSDLESQPIILCCYRLPATQPDSTLGMSWLQTNNSPDTETLGTTAALPPTPPPMVTEPDQLIEEGINQLVTFPRAKPSQAITCCVALPTAQGVGFVVGSSGGLVSIFTPIEKERPSWEVNKLFSFYLLVHIVLFKSSKAFNISSEALGTSGIS